MDKILYTKTDILNQLRAMNAPTDSVVIMHSSLRAIGEVQGGASALLDTLIEYFTSGGGLFCVPTHTWNNIRNEITLDLTSDDHCLGALSTVAIRDGRGLRTENPTHSMVIFGDREKAEAFAADEPYVTSGTAPESCYGKLYTMGGKVLLVGVAQNRNTYLHAVDEILEIPDRLSEKPYKTAVKRPSGEIVERETYGHRTSFTNDVSLRFVKFDTAFRYHRAIIDGFIGNAPAQLCDARKMKETMELIFKNSDGEDVLKNEFPISQNLYCKR
jgi:aminoglycoside 3-N-acetyltransferase